ncbi:MAG: hypothetical protein HY618_07720 [Candidatus Tectomicrobia bacterium]|uniref:Uncharacterized protein n=1 Tax=Tectimicrobiota bacterium TaxID=2528274 RepID=A0A932ZY48_UNCTE|nr:hypothetical protein [Candidatus Tectomicrobia bacterium]MBI4252332.1 hypothetical protein [Candidatus Tectomicrobia bacterium]
MIFFTAITILSSIVTLIGFFLPFANRRTRYIHIGYGIFIVLITSMTLSYAGKLSKIERVEQAASRLIENRRFDYTSIGFIHAALAFMEKIKTFSPMPINVPSKCVKSAIALEWLVIGKISCNIALI